MKIIFATLLLVNSVYSYAQSNLRSKTIVLRRLLEQKHYQPVNWNDTASQLLYTKWLEKLDDEKLFFTQKEIAVLDGFKNKLDEEILGNGWLFFGQSTMLYKQRLLKTDSIIKVLTQKPFDFSKPDNLTWPFTSFAANEAELVQRWQKYLKWQVLNQIAKKQSDSNGVSSKLPTNFPQLETAIRSSLRTKESAYLKNILGNTPNQFVAELEEKYLNTIAWCYDPHTNYMSSKKKDAFDAATSATEFSSGLDLEENDDGDIAIDYLQPGSSAWRSGQLHKGDVIQSVNVGGKKKI
ncbi:MAG: hypothetical protein IPP48_00375 [Chitinophagaceae bacterium]|nr:hypothetical protein [Chitinophagaceae bacterium]